MLLMTLVVKALTTDASTLSFTLDEYAVFHNAGLVPVIPEVNAALERDPSLTVLAKAMLRGEVISEKAIKALQCAGKGGQGGVYNNSDSDVIKLYEEKEAHKHKYADGQTISQTGNEVPLNDRQHQDAEHEWNRLHLCAHEHVLKAYAMAVTDRNSRAILLQRAANGDAE